MMERVSASELLLLIIAKVLLFLLFPLYLVLRLFFLITTDYGIWSVLSYVFFIVELYFIIHATNYLVSYIHSTKHYPGMIRSVPRRENGSPKTAVFIASFNEPSEVVEDTMLAAKRMNYPKKEIYLLDDSDDPQIILEVDAAAKRNGIPVIRRQHRTGFKGGSLNEAIARVECDYVAVFDSDQQPEKNFLSELIPIFEADASIGFIQTPQLPKKSLVEGGFVESAAASSQYIFYRHVCEGKGAINAQFSCGSNVVYRRSALESIRRNEGDREIYLDEWSVTEDYASSVLLHEKGWKSLFYNKTHGNGLVPATLDAFKAQRSRWAIGTTSVFLRYFPRILFGKNFSTWQKWEYIISGTYFLLGMANFLMIINAAIFVLLDIPTYAFLSLVLFIFNSVVFHYSQRLRGNWSRNLFYEQVLNFLMFPMYLDAVVAGLLGRNVTFTVTRKFNGGSRDAADLRIQKGVLVVMVLVFSFGVWRFLSTGGEYVLINLFWIGYIIFMLAAGLILMKLEESRKPQSEPAFWKNHSPRLFGDGWHMPATI